MISRTVLSTICLAGLAFGAAAQNANGAAQSADSAPAFSTSALDWVRIQFGNQFNREPYDWSLKQVERQFGVLFDAARISGGDGISAQDEKLAEDIAQASQRANAIRTVLSADINGDGKVTREEVRMMLRQRYSKRMQLHREARMQREFDRIFVNDANRDGTITIGEIVESHQKRAVLSGSRNFRSSSSNAVPMSLDRNGDAVVTRDELVAAVRVVFAEIDRDKDRMLSDSEMRDFMATIREVRRRQSQERRQSYAARRIARQIMRCSFPTLPDGTKLVFAAAYRGEALANVSIKGKQQLLTVGQIDIEPGSEPLTMVLSSPANMIWQMTGATERVAKVLVGSRFSLGGKASTAVTGVANDKVHFIPTSNCLPTHFNSDQEREQIGLALKATLRTSPQAIVSLNVARKVSLPSGKIDKAATNPQAIAPPKDSPGAALWNAVRRSFPAGIVRLDPDKIVSQEKLAAAPVLPGRAGLAQLIDQGALEVPAVAPGGRIVLPITELKIVAPIQMPAGLSQAIVRKFVLAKGVKAPEGVHARLCVIGEADGKPVDGSGPCRR